ncbi:hypothetical protein ANO14919_068730 [Xylariales sp. No.14919]|nr:hypothetical protein ANO14919_068730 [Xylariales sp. No.14919]
MAVRDVARGDRDAVDDVAGAVRRVGAAEQAPPAPGPLAVRAEDQVRPVDLAGGEAQGGRVEIDVGDLAAQLDFDPVLPRAGEQGAQEVGAVNHDVRRRAADELRIRHGRRRREHVAAVGAEGAGLGPVGVREDLVQHAPVPKQARGVGG